ncbi:MAG: capsular biosynthesis protein [Chloroflexi bacterium]|nr:capsular biosynthesis protein [Chloroflexota bacterium]
MKLCLVCSHGGHMTELLELKSVWSTHEVFFITYFSKRELPARAYTYSNLTKYPLKVVPMFFSVAKVLRKERPEWVISDGAEIAIPVFAAARLLGIKTMYIESVCRVNTPSFTGRVVYPLSDVFLVQWPELLARFGSKARYEGGLI